MELRERPSALRRERTRPHPEAPQSGKSLKPSKLLSFDIFDGSCMCDLNVYEERLPLKDHFKQLPAV